MYLDDLKKLTEQNEDKTFLQADIHKAAKKDFNYLCMQTEYATFNKLHFVNVKTSDNARKDLGDFLVLGHDIASGKQISFPQGLIDTDNPKQFLAVVAYKNNSVVNVFVFQTDSFKTTSLFGLFKQNAKTNQYGVVIGDGSNKKLQPHSFGLVLKNLEEN